jgi:hypothetical protein
MSSKGVLPAEGFEPPTYGLQNRCTTTVLSRHTIARPEPVGGDIRPLPAASVKIGGVGWDC